jgi:hypothetical protein
VQKSPEHATEDRESVLHGFDLARTVVAIAGAIGFIASLVLTRLAHLSVGLGATLALAGGLCTWMSALNPSFNRAPSRIVRPSESVRGVTEMPSPVDVS